MEKEFLDNIIEIIENQDAVKLKIILDDMHPADIAELCDMLNVDDARLIYHQLDNETAADVLVEMDEDNRKRLLDELPSEIIAKKFIDNMETDDAVDIIQDLDEEKQEEVLAHIDDIEQASDIVDLMQYDEDSAGGLMATEMVVVNENMSMPECLQEMRKQAEDLDDIYNVLSEPFANPCTTKADDCVPTFPPVPPINGMKKSSDVKAANDDSKCSRSLEFKIPPKIPISNQGTRDHI